MEKIGIVILHYGDPKVTDKCVKSILSADRQRRIHIVVVDNDFENRRVITAKRYQNEPCVTVLKNTEQHGFSHANNMGYRYAREELECTCILVVNNDVEFLQQDLVERLERAVQQESCFILAPDVVRAGTGEHQNPLAKELRTAEEAEFTVKMNRTALKFFDILYLFLIFQYKNMEKKETKRRKLGDSYKKKQKNIVPFGACLVYMSRFVEREKRAFEPETNFYYEEYLLALRCRRKGYEILYDPSIQVFHESGSSTRTSLKNEKEKLRFIMQNTADSCSIYAEEKRTEEI